MSITEKLSIERVVALLTPLFAVAAGAISTGVGSATGVPSKDYVALFIAGATAALGAALKWLDGRAKFVQFKGDVEGVVHTVVGQVMANTTAAPALGDIEGLLRLHVDPIVAALAADVHASPSVAEIMREMAAKLENSQSAIAQAGTTTVGGLPPAPNAPVA